jgi:hypothetical protein
MAPYLYVVASEYVAARLRPVEMATVIRQVSASQSLRLFPTADSPDPGF